MNSERAGPMPQPAWSKNEKNLRTLLTNLILTELVLVAASWLSDAKTAGIDERPADLTAVFSAFVEVDGVYRPITQHVFPFVFGTQYYDAGLIAGFILALVSFSAITAFFRKRYWFTCVLFVVGLMCHEFAVAVPFLLVVIIGMKRRSHVEWKHFARNTIPLFVILSVYSAFRYEHAAQPQKAFQPRQGPRLSEAIPFAVKNNQRVSIQTAQAGGAVTTGYAVIEGINGEFNAEVSVRYGPAAAQQISIPAIPMARSGRIDLGLSSHVRTAIAIANANPVSTTIDSSHGTSSIPAWGQLAVFLDEKPFAAKPFKGSFEFRSTQPVAFAALSIVTQGFETRMRVLPVKGNEAAARASPPLVFPHFAFGGGYSSRFVISSKTAADRVPVVLRFFSPSGRPLEVPAHCYGC